MNRALLTLALLPLTGAPALAQTSLFDLSDVADPFGSLTQGFGRSVDVHGVFGVAGSNDGAWLLEREDTGRWALGDELVPFDFASNVGFGRAVAMDTNRIAVGAPDDDGATADSGSIYLYDRVGSTWFATSKLFLPSPVTDVDFGAAVAVDGERVVVGAPGAQSPFGSARTGVVHVFDREPGGNWVLDATLAIPSTDELRFGAAVDLEGDRIVVGAPFEALGFGQGRAFVFDRGTGGNWALTQELIPSVSQTNDAYGFAVDLEGGRIAVGAPRYDGLQLDVGAVFVWNFVGPDWKQAPILEAPSLTLGDRNGTSVALAGDVLYAGAPGENGVSTWTGATRRWEELASSSWQFDGSLPAPDGASGWYAGSAVAIHEATLLVGSPGSDFSVGATPGAVSSWWGFDTTDDVLPPSVVGTWSGGCAGPIALDLNLPPLVSSSDFEVRTTSPGPNLAGLLAVGFGVDSSGPDLLGLGITIYIDPFTVPAPLLLEASTGPDSTASTPLPLPGNVAGLTVWLQSFWIDPTCPSNPLGVSSSNCLEVTLGKP